MLTSKQTEKLSEWKKETVGIAWRILGEREREREKERGGREGKDKREKERERTAHRERMLGRQGHLSGKMNLLCLAFTTSSRTRRSLSPFSFHETGPDWRAINPLAFTRQCIEICEGCFSVRKSFEIKKELFE